MVYYLTPFGSLVVGLALFIILFKLRESIGTVPMIYDIAQMFFGSLTAISGIMWEADTISRFLMYANITGMVSTFILYFFVILGVVHSMKRYKPEIFRGFPDPTKRTFLIAGVSLLSCFIFLYVTNYISFVSYTYNIEATYELYFKFLLFGTMIGMVGGFISDVLGGGG